MLVRSSCKRNVISIGLIIIIFFIACVQFFLPVVRFGPQNPSRKQSPDAVPTSPGEIRRPHELKGSIQSDVCFNTFGEGYLRKLQSTATEYCTKDSASKLTCFHTQITPDIRVDSFCYGTLASLRQAQKKFFMSCRPRLITEEDLPYGARRVEDLPQYWYDTGPGHIFTKDVVLESGEARDDALPSVNISILVRREGPNNLWHSLMEIFSMALTIEALRSAINPSTGRPFVSREDADHTRVVILDQHDEGPYYDLWNFLGQRPTIRLRDELDMEQAENIIVPLAGGSNPLWLGDWEPHSCRGSTLLDAFVKQVLKRYDLCEVQPSGERIQVTFIHRAESRRLLHENELLAMVRERLPAASVQVVDFATLNFNEQIRLARETDILVGVHGAGLTHGIFMRPSSAMVEILPPSLKHKGFRNIAGLLQHSYFSAHGQPVSTDAEDWHMSDVSITAESFLELVTVAVKSMYNQGRLNMDVA